MSFSYTAYAKTQEQHDIISYDKKGRLTLKLETGTEYLTKREAEILQYILQGHSAKKIGLFLNISFRTVESYINMLKMKFHCNRKNDLIGICARLGILRLSFEVNSSI